MAAFVEIAGIGIREATGGRSAAAPRIRGDKTLRQVGLEVAPVIIEKHDL